MKNITQSRFVSLLYNYLDLVIKIIILLIFITVLGIMGLLVSLREKASDVSVPVDTFVFEKRLKKYAIEELIRADFPLSEISFGELVKEEEDFKSYRFYFYSDQKRVSGLINVPEGPGVYPIIVMFRGYVDREKYLPGIGSARMGEFLAKRGYITIACDFLGYGESDNPSSEPIEERFQTYTTALSLIRSLPNLNPSLALVSPGISGDVERVGIWGHSNGGHIALAVLEITGMPYPTVLWAPVSKPFPYSILYYTDEFEDHGKMLRKVVADFEKDYDSEMYSITNYFDLINSPIQIHQGTDDEAVPVNWSGELVENLKKLEKKVEYFKYFGEDHNFAGGNWPIVAQRSLKFYQENLPKNQKQ